jgi:hypothetical protein
MGSKGWDNNYLISENIFIPCVMVMDSLLCLSTGYFSTLTIPIEIETHEGNPNMNGHVLKGTLYRDIKLVQETIT